jgi:hypothetical protein
MNVGVHVDVGVDVGVGVDVNVDVDVNVGVGVSVDVRAGEGRGVNRALTVEKTSEGPNVGLFVVLDFIQLLWRHVVWRAHKRSGVALCV